MALHWSLEICENADELMNDNNWGITNALIWTTMVIGMGRISAENADEFFARVDTVQKATGQLCYAVDEQNEMAPYMITHADIVRRIGLGTNASSMTKAQFFKHVEKISEFNIKKIKSLYEEALNSVSVPA